MRSITAIWALCYHSDSYPPSEHLFAGHLGSHLYRDLCGSFSGGLACCRVLGSDGLESEDHLSLPSGSNKGAKPSCGSGLGKAMVSTQPPYPDP